MRKTRRMDASAARAESQIVDKITNNTPIEDRIRGAQIMLSQNFGPAGFGWTYLYQVFEGTWVIYEISIDNFAGYDMDRAAIRIRRQPETEYANLNVGSSGSVNALQWSGRLILQGSWVVQGSLSRPYNYGDAIVASMRIICEKLEDR